MLGGHFLPTATVRRRATKSVVACHTATENRYVLAESRGKSQQRGAGITRWVRDENQGERRGKASWISGLSGGRAEPAGGSGAGGSRSGVWGNLCSLRGPAPGEAGVGMGVRSTQDGAWRT